MIAMIKLCVSRPPVTIYGKLAVEMLNDQHPQVIPPPTASYGKAPGDVERDVGKLLQHALNIAGRGPLTW